MTLITASPLIKDLKKKILLTYLCKHYNIELEVHGNRLYGYCPFHEDTSLSLVIIPRQNRWKCMKPCCRGGGNIHFLMKLEKISFHQAVERLRFFMKTKSVNDTSKTTGEKTVLA